MKLKNNKIAMYFDFKLLIVIIPLLFFIASCASPSRFRVLVVNKAEQQLEISKYFYTDPSQIEGRGFDELFKAGQKENLKNGYWIHIKWPIIKDYNYFWVGIKNSKGEHWVLNQKFEEYGRYWFDISEGLRIDYIIAPNGEIKKDYWD